MELKIGDAVTVAMLNDPPTRDLVLRLGRVIRVGEMEFDVQMVVHKVHVDVGRKYVDEGTRWCRGHTGPEVDALAAVQAL